MSRTRALILGTTAVAAILYVSLFYYKITEPEPTIQPIILEHHDTTNYLPYVNCGTGWQQKYADLHKRTLAGENDGRVLVSIAVEGGIADNLSGLMTEFYLALLSDRALQIYHYGFLPPYEPAFEPVFFNWSNPGYPDILTDNLKYTYKGERGYTGDRSYPPEVNTTENWFIYQMNNHFGDKDEMFERSNLLTTIPKDHVNAKRVFMMSNRGMTYKLGAKNPYHKNQLLEMGLTPETMFGCAFRALFRPTQALMRRNQEYLSVMRDPSFFKIGIMIRVGDDSFGSKGMDENRYNGYKHYFRCATEVEEAYNTEKKPVIWYLQSDSLDLRRKAKVEYGSKILTDVETLVIHPDCAAHEKHTCSHEMMTVALMQAAGQVINFAWADYHVITRGSGFGRVGAVLGAGNNHIYSVEGEPSHQGPCTAGKYDGWDDRIATDWAGI